MKDSFVLYNDYVMQTKLLSMEQRGVLFTAILAYVNEMILPDMDDTVGMAYSFITARIERDREKYEEVCRRRREAGKRGAAAKSAHDAPREEDEAPSQGYGSPFQSLKTPQNGVKMPPQGFPAPDGLPKEEPEDTEEPMEGSWEEKFGFTEEDFQGPPDPIGFDDSWNYGGPREIFNSTKRAFEYSRTSDENSKGHAGLTKAGRGYRKQVYEDPMDEKVYRGRDYFAGSGLACKTHAQIMDDWELSPNVRVAFENFLRHCYVNGQIVTNARLNDLIYRLTDTYSPDEGAIISALEEAVNGGYFDVTEARPKRTHFLKMERKRQYDTHVSNAEIGT